MKTSKLQPEELLQKYLDGQCTPEEKLFVEKSYNLLEQESAESDVEPDYAYWHQAIKDRLPKAPGRASLWPRIAIAAAAVAAITLGTWLYYTPSSSRGTEGSLAYASDIAPGSVGATLTLANGKTIKLSSAINGELAKEAGVTIKKTADGQLIYEIASSSASPRNDGAELKTNTLSTAKGETYQVKLPDGTAVWLNAASRLTYSATLSQQGQRRVVLEGEAYFQVAKDKTHPFIVESKGQQVEVLGTHFNINAYADEGNTKTTLLEGSVKVSTLSSRVSRDLNAIILKPNQQATNTGTNITVTTVEAADAIAWKEGFFLFNREGLESVMNKISRWYKVAVVFEDPSLKKETILGTMSRYEQLSKVLNLLKRTGVATFDVRGDTIYVTRK